MKFKEDKLQDNKCLVFEFSIYPICASGEEPWWA